LGPEVMVETLKRFGFEGEFQPLPSLALGAQNVSLLEMVKAYGALANQGLQAEPVAILRIEDAQGRVLVEAKQELKPLLKKEETFLLTHMMEHVFLEGGTGHRVASL